MPRAVAIVQARIGSARLPGKCLLAFGHQTMLAHVLERVGAMCGVSERVLATSISRADDPVALIGYRVGWLVHRGSEWDVLGRVRNAVHMTDCDVVVRVTADCPFWDPAIGAEVLRSFVEDAPVADYVSNDTTCSGYPDGLDVEVFSRGALEICAATATDHADREHVTPWIRRHLRCRIVRHPVADHSLRKLSVDTPADYERAQAIARYLQAGAFDLDATLAAVARSEAHDA